MELPPGGNTARDGELCCSRTRVRVCKRCKFSTSDGKEFLHHQINAHSESIETFSCDKCNFLTVASIELQKHKQTVHEVRQSPSEDNKNSNINAAQDSETECEKQSVNFDPDLQAEKSDEEFCVVNNITLPTRTYACQDCGLSTTSSRQHLHHLVEAHGYDYNIYECDICDYATRYKQKLPRHRKCHFTQPSETSCMKTEDIVKMEVADSNMNSIPRDSAVKSLLSNDILDPHSFTSKVNEGMKGFLVSERSMGLVDKNLLNGGSLYDKSRSKANVSHESDDETRLVIDTRPQEMSPDKPSPAEVTVAKPAEVPRKRPGPREAVDPAKYVRVQEVDGIKYACSKCGNVYKWKKSLNKHWKEKHDGEIPVPHSGSFPVLKVPSLRGSPNRSGPIHRDSSGSSFLESSMEDSLPTQVPYRQSSVFTPKSDHRRSSPLTFSATRGSGGMSSRDSTPRMMRMPYSSSTPVSRDRMQNMSWGSPDFSSHSSTPLHGSTFQGKQSTNVKEEIASSERLSQKYSNGPLTSVKMPYRPQPSSHEGLPPPAAHAYYGTKGLLYKEDPDDAMPLDLSKSSKTRTPSTSQPFHSGSQTVNRLSPVSVDQDQPLDFSKPSSDSKLSSSRMRLPVHVKEERENAEKLFYNRKSSGELNGHKTVFGNWQCSVCAHVAKTKTEFDEHMEFHLKKRNLKCAECMQCFREMEELNRHFVCNHSDILRKNALQNESSFPINDKNRESVQLYKFLTQARVPHLCIVCGQEFAWQWDLTRHFEQAHPNMTNPYKKRDQTEAGLTGRESPKRFRGDDSNLKCTQCHFVARTAEELSRHHLVHSLNKPFACTMCGFSSKYQDELVRHIGNYHKSSQDNSDERKIDAQAMSPENRSLHSSRNSSPAPSLKGNLVQMATPDGGLTTVDLNAEGTVIVIPEAPEETTVPAVGRNRGQKGVKSDNSAESLLPYKCTKCEYRARWPSEINQHMKNHSDEKPFLCPFCNYKSKWKWDVVKHLKRCGGGTVKDVIDTSKQTKEDESHWVRAVNNQANNSSSPVNVLSNGPPNVTVLPSSPPAAIPSPSFQYEGANIEEASRPVPYHRMGAISPTGKETSSPIKPNNQGFYNCLQCPFVGNSPAELKRHCRVHSDEKPFMCLSCTYSTKWKCDLKKHLRTYNHVAAGPLDGEESGPKDKETDLHCHEEGVDNMDLEHEMLESPKQEVFRCDKCLYVTYQKHLLESHMKIHVQRSEQKSSRRKCKQCDFEAEDLPSFLQHKMMHASQQGGDAGGNNVRESSEDRDSEVNSPAASTSPTRHRRKALMQFRCSRCTFTCLKRSDLELHEAMHESARQDTYKCSFCDYSVNNRANLIQHMRSHMEMQEDEGSNEEDRPVDYSCLQPDVDHQKGGYRCEKCPYITNHRNNYLKHIVNHGTNNKYTCEWCDWSIDRINLLYRHAKCVHKDQLNQQVKSSKHKDSQNKHSITSDSLPMSLHDLKKPDDALSIGSRSGTGDNTPNESEMETEDSCVEDNFEAEESGKDVGPTRKKRKLRTCQECGYTTDNITNLQRHQKKHGQNGLYKCDFCSFSLDRLSLINQHMNMIHGTSRKGGQHRQPKVMPVPGRSVLGPLEALRCSPLTTQSFSEDNDDGDSEGSAVSVAEMEDCVTNLVNVEVTGTATVKGKTVQVVTSQGKKYYRCPNCPFTSRMISGMSMHIRHHDSGGRYACEYCDYSLNQLQYILQHMRSVHQEEENTSEDSLLPEAEDGATDLTTNGQSSLKNIEQYETEEMSQINRDLFLSSIGLKPVNEPSPQVKPALQQQPRGRVQPSLSTRGKGRVRYRCTKCPYTTVYRGNIFKHRRQHVISSKYTCRYCNYSATRWHVLEKHVKFHQQELEQGGPDSRNEKYNDIFMDPDRDIEYALSDEGSMLLNLSSRGDYPSSPCMDGSEKNSYFESGCSNYGNTEKYSTKKKNFFCEMCPFNASSQTDLDKHSRYHGASLSFKCDLCDFSIHRMNLMFTHRKLHVGEEGFNPHPPVDALLNENFKCNPAPESSDGQATDPKTLDKEDKVEKPESKPVGVFNSEDMTSKPVSVTPSKKSNHLSKIRLGLKGTPQRNPLCNKRTRLPSGEYKCTQCPYACSNKQSFVYHENLHKGKGRYKCDKCSYRVNQLNTLYQHTRLHSLQSGLDTKKFRIRQPNKKRFRCSKCPYHTHSRVILSQHTKLHAAGKRFACKFCDYSISRLNLLHQHLKLHSVENKESMDSSSNHKKEKETSSSSSVRASLKITPVNFVPSDKKFYYKCDRCPYQTNNRGNFENHKSQHLVRSKLQCPYCDYSSDRSMQLGSHIRMHFPSSKLDAETLKSLIKEANEGKDWNPGTPVGEDAEAYSPGTSGELQESRVAQNNNNIENKTSCKRAADSEHVCQFCDRHFENVAEKCSHEKQHLVGTLVH